MRLVEVAAIALLLALLVLAGAIVGFSAALDSWLWGTVLGVAVGGPPLLAAGALWRAVERTGAPKAFGLRDVTLTPEEASTYLAGKLDESITVGQERRLTDEQIRLAEFVRPRLGDAHGIIHRYVSEVLDADAVPMYKHVLHVEADANNVTITCHPATGLEQPGDPLPVEDQVVIPLEPARAMMTRARGGAIPV
jgi:hypothetical protein